MATSPPPTGTGRRVEHVSEACIPCRSKKLKCDKANKKERGKERDREACQRCITASRDCIWSTKGDARGAITKDLVNSQQSRIHYLEQENVRLQNQLQSVRGPPNGCDLVMQDMVPPEHMRKCDTNHERLDKGHELPNCVSFYDSTSPFSFLSESEHQFNPDDSAILPDPTFSVGRRFAGDVDWARHLPNKVVPRLLTREQHDVLLDLFFKFFTTCYSNGLRKRFEVDMHHALSPRRDNRGDAYGHYSAMLHNAILAIATTYADSKQLRDIDNRMEFARKAEEHIIKEFERPTLSGVQAFAYLAEFYLDLGRKVDFLQHSTICIRMVEAMRLKTGADRRLFDSGPSGAQVGGRDSVFWTTFIQDKLSSFYYGRVCAMPIPGRHLSAALEQSAEVNGNLATHQVRLFVIATELKDSLGPGYTEDDMTKIALVLDKWFNQLPHSMRVSRPQVAANVEPEILVLDITYEWLTIHAHRPFYGTRPSKLQELAVKRCDQAATRIVQLLGCYKRLHSIRFVPLAVVQMMVAAGSVFIYKARQLDSDSSGRKATMRHFTQCIGFLRDMENTWNCAAEMRKILERVRTTCLTGDGDVEMDVDMDEDMESDGSPSSYGPAEATPSPVVPVQSPQSPPHNPADTPVVSPPRPITSPVSSGGVTENYFVGPRSDFLPMHVNPNDPDPGFMNLLNNHNIPETTSAAFFPMGVTPFDGFMAESAMVLPQPLSIFHSSAARPVPTPIHGKNLVARGPIEFTPTSPTWNRVPSALTPPTVTMYRLGHTGAGVGSSGPSSRMGSSERASHSTVVERNEPPRFRPSGGGRGQPGMPGMPW